MHFIADTTDAAVALGGFFTVFAAVFVLILLVSALALFLLWLVMLIDAFNRKQWPSSELRIIVIIVLLVSLPLQLYWLTALLYYFSIKRPLDAGRTPSFLSDTSWSSAPKKRKRTTRRSKK
ncbi:hypothetical protein IT415_02050 [bacterium]|nr:hypothetical protein [bacterium]